MRKLILSATLTLLFGLMLATTASAAVYYHGDFATNSTGCAKCHVTHAADAARLLISGPTQTDFCYYCHGDITSSPYNAADGKIRTSAGTLPSVAGGFERTFDFDNVAYDTTNGGVDGNYIANSSMHGVETYDSDTWATGVQIPGGTNTLTGDFRCGSCHNPHAGGSYNGTNRMPRLLNATLPEATFTPAAFGAWTMSANEVTGGFNSTTVETYGDGISAWCAGCHDLFRQTAHQAGQAAEGTTGKYMHRMDFTLSAAGQLSLGGFNTIEHMPLSASDKLNCLTCHRAHGTASLADDVGVFNRAATYKVPGSVDADVIDSTVLLRLKDRDVCYNCHGAGVNNTVATQGS